MSYSSITDINISYDTTPRWCSYLIAGFMGLVEYLASGRDLTAVGRLVTPARGIPQEVLDNALKTLRSSAVQQQGGDFTDETLQLLAGGNIPVAAGVSSSSALVVASTMAFAAVLGVELTPRDLADLCCNAERHVGTAGGGMDQAAICLSKTGAAQLINFDPLQSEVIPLPPAARFVVSNTFKEAPKAVHAATHYNRRVFECRVATLLLHNATSTKVETEEVPRLTLRKLQDKLGFGILEMEVLVENSLKKTPYTKDELERLAGKEALEALFASPIGPGVWDKNTSFELYRRAIHVVREARRVHTFVEVCGKALSGEKTPTAAPGGANNTGGAVAENKSTTQGSGGRGNAVLEQLGALMNESDASLTALFDCSCPELVSMTAFARQSGAYGSRLTGAGWGGCVVSLVHEDDVGAFCNTMQQYYKDCISDVSTIPSDPKLRVFPVTPADGAKIYSGNY